MDGGEPPPGPFVDDRARPEDEREADLGALPVRSRSCPSGSPAERAGAVDADWALRLMRAAIAWYAIPGGRRFGARDRQPDPAREPPSDERRAASKAQVNQLTLPADALLIRRMHGIVAVVMSQLRAGADWGAIAAEYLHGSAAATALGEAEAAFFGASQAG